MVRQQEGAFRLSRRDHDPDHRRIEQAGGPPACASSPASSFSDTRTNTGATPRARLSTARSTPPAASSSTSTAQARPISAATAPTWFFASSGRTSMASGRASIRPRACAAARRGGRGWPPRWSGAGPAGRRWRSRPTRTIRPWPMPTTSGFTTTPHGHRCPIGAHIRRTNPRKSLGPRPGSPEALAGSRRHRLLRRGRAYGPRLAKSMDPEDVLAEGGRRPGAGPPFHLPCRQHRPPVRVRSASWADNPQFETLHDDVDPLIGRRGRFAAGNGRTSATANFTIPGHPARTRIRGLPDFATVRGGAYFFMPGVSGLRYLTHGS